MRARGRTPLVSVAALALGALGAVALSLALDARDGEPAEASTEPASALERNLQSRSSRRSWSPHRWR